MMTEMFGKWGAALVCVMCLMVGIGGIAVGYKSYTTLERFDRIINELQRENVELRDTLSTKSNQPIPKELTLVVKDRSGKKSLASQNRNLLNIKRLPSGDKWVGEIGVDRQGHVIFSDEAYSVRAGALTLISYEKRHGIDTVAKLVRRFSETNHEEYERFLCGRLKVKKDQKISLKEHLPTLLKSIIEFETGMKVDYEYIKLVASSQ